MAFVQGSNIPGAHRHGSSLGVSTQEAVGVWGGEQGFWGYPEGSPCGLGRRCCCQLRHHWCHCGQAGKEQRQVALGGEERGAQSQHLAGLKRVYRIVHLETRP